MDYKIIKGKYLQKSHNGARMNKSLSVYLSALLFSEILWNGLSSPQAYQSRPAQRFSRLALVSQII